MWSTLHCLLSFSGLAVFRSLVSESETNIFPDNDLLFRLQLVTKDAEKCSLVAQQLLAGKRQTRCNADTHHHSTPLHTTPPPSHHTTTTSRHHHIMPPQPHPTIRELSSFPRGSQSDHHPTPPPPPHQTPPPVSSLLSYPFKKYNVHSNEMKYFVPWHSLNPNADS